MVAHIPLGLNIDLNGTDDAGFSELGRIRPGIARQIITALDFEWLDKLTAAGRQHGFEVMLCLGGKYREGGAADAWKEIAARYPQVWCDLVNEPQQDAQAWSDEAEAIGIEVLRVNPDAKIAVQFPGTFYVTAPQMRRMPFPCWYSLHWYLDFNYTHQGIGGRPAPVKYENFQYWLRWWAAPVIYWMAANNAQVFVGEFSVNRAAPDCDQWLRDAMRLFNALRWPWLYHAFRGSSYWDAENSPVWREIVSNF